MLIQSLFCYFWLLKSINQNKCMTDQEAFEKLKDGDSMAMEWVYRNKRDPFVHYFIKHFKISADSATDLFADTIIALLKFAQSEKNPSLTSQLSTLLIAIGRNIHFKNLKPQSKLPVVNWDDYLEFAKNTEGGENPFETTDFEDILPLIEGFVNRMGDPCHSILKQYYWEKHTDKEVTEVLKDMPNIKDMSEGAVKMKRVRCIETLRKLIFNLPK